MGLGGGWVRFFLSLLQHLAGAAVVPGGLFVRPQFRDKGIGKALLGYVANIAKNENCRAMRWEVLNWNKSAIELYESLGATFLDDWRLVLLPSAGVQRLAEKAA